MKLYTFQLVLSKNYSDDIPENVTSVNLNLEIHLFLLGKYNDGKDFIASLDTKDSNYGVQ